MKFSFTLATALFLPVMVNAQSGNSTGASSIQVQVGPGLSFNPSNFTATNGTNVTFIFPTSAAPHSVTQSSFAEPCVYLNGSAGAGFDSGLQTEKQFTIRITNDQEPVWFFCKTTNHCGLGMVGAINPPTSGNTFDAFVAAAKAIGSNEQAITDHGPVTGGVGAVATGTPVPTSASSSSPTSNSSAGHLAADGLFALLAAAFGITLA